MTLRELLFAGEKILKDAGNEDAGFEASELLFSVMKINRTAFYLSAEKNAGTSVQDKFMSLIKRRLSGEPLQYIAGSWDFYGSVFFVGEGVLIPRPETEEMTDICIKEIKKNPKKIIYDLCTGTGCIGISIAKNCPGTECYLFEYEDRAFSYAEKNIKVSGLSEVHLIRCNVLTGEGADNIPSPDMIVSNPPYINSDEISSLQKEVHYEPREALDGGEDGLDFYRAISEIWLPRLNAGGYAAVECGEGQCEDIAALFGKYLDTLIYTDMYGCRRFVAGTLKEENYVK